MSNKRHRSHTSNETELTWRELDAYETLADEYDCGSQHIYCHIGASHFDKDMLSQSVADGLNPDFSVPWAITTKPSCGLWGSRDDMPGGWLDFVESELMQKCSDPNNQDKQFYFEVTGNILNVSSIYDIGDYVYPCGDRFFVDYDAMRSDGYDGVNFDISSLKEIHNGGPDFEADDDLKLTISICEQRFIDEVSCDSLVVWNPNTVFEVPEMVVQMRRGEHSHEMREWISNNRELIQDYINNGLISFGHLVRALDGDVDKIIKFSPTEQERDEVQEMLREHSQSSSRRQQGDLASHVAFDTEMTDYSDSVGIDISGR